MYDKNGKFSSARFAFLAVVFVALFLTCWIVIDHREVTNAVILFSAFIVEALAIKTASKYQEQKDEN